MHAHMFASSELVPHTGTAQSVRLRPIQAASLDKVELPCAPIPMWLVQSAMATDLHAVQVRELHAAVLVQV